MSRILDRINNARAGNGDEADELPGGERASGEVALWRAVITQALMDAGSQSSKREMKQDRAQAIAWLAGTSDDFKEICARAELDPDYVRVKAQDAVRRGCAWRREAAQFIQKEKGKVEKSARTPKRFNSVKNLLMVA